MEREERSGGAARGRRKPLSRPVCLVGMPGCGKTTVGKRLASLLGAPFFDSDALVEAREGRSVSAVFASEGEAAFRHKERETIRALLAREEPLVLAVGGGAFVQADTRDIILAHSVAVWLKPPFETLLTRTSRKKTRPLLEGGDKRTILQGLMESRYPAYAKAQVTVETREETTLMKTATSVTEALERYGL
jgi:shikimate kinase